MALYRPTIPPIYQPTLAEIMAVNQNSAFPWEFGGGTSPLVASLLGQNFSRNSEGSYLISAPTNGSTAFLEWGAIDVLRLEDRGDGAGPLVLLESERVNTVTRSEALNTGGAPGWAGGGTVGADATTAPDGASDADRLTVNGNTTSPNDGARRYFGVVAAGVYATSVFCKIGSQGTGAYLQTVDGAGAGLAITPTSVWQRVLKPSSTTTAFMELFSNTTGQGGTGVSGDNHFFWGAQMELAGVYPTSYIRTAGATGTRRADNLALTSTPAWLLTGAARFRQFSPIYKHTELSSGNVRWLFTIGSANDGVRVRHNGTDVRIEAVAGGVVKAQSGALTFAAAHSLLGAVQWNPITAVVSVGGVAGAAGTPWTWSSGTVRVGGIQGGSGNELDGRLYPLLEAA